MWETQPSGKKEQIVHGRETMSLTYLPEFTHVEILCVFNKLFKIFKKNNDMTYYS